MGTEAANVHLGTRHRVKDILKDLRRSKSRWLQAASKAMAKAIEKDWKDYKRG
jgi:hypothetical protein